jgi:hypothetical protein
MTTATLERAEQITRVLRDANEAVERVKNDAPQQFPEAASAGDAVRQGDVYIQLIDDVTSAPMLYERVLQPVFPLQLAEGTSKGSRHCLAHGNGVTVYQPMVANSYGMIEQLARQYPGVDVKSPNLRSELREAEWAARRKDQNADILTLAAAAEMVSFAGPILVLTEPNVVTHPEHGDWMLPAGTYRITYQRTVAKDNTIARVID